jgi:hypothetical protein
MTEAETNSLGLAFEQVKLSDEAVSPAPSSSTTAEAEASTPATKKDKKTVYVRDAVAPRVRQTVFALTLLFSIYCAYIIDRKK